MKRRDFVTGAVLGAVALNQTSSAASSSTAKKNAQQTMFADFHQLLDLGDVDKGIVNVVIEMPKGSNNKIEWQRDSGLFMLDRVEPMIFAKPTNYGFIPRTKNEDGDELDALILTDTPLPTGIYLQARIIGVIRFDDGEKDHKILAVPEDDRHTGNHIKTLADVPKQILAQIEHHFLHYKDLRKPNTTKVDGFGDAEEGKALVKAMHENWQKWQDR